jgi:hypothetical protein
MNSQEAGGGIPHNPEKLAFSTLRRAPEHRPFGSGVKKPESQDLPRAKTPDVSTPAVEDANPTAKNPAEQQARERLSKPPPEEASSIVDSPVQEQDELQSDEQEELDELDVEFSPEDFGPAIFRCNTVNSLFKTSTDEPEGS